MVNVKRIAIAQLFDEINPTKPILFPFSEEEMKRLIFDYAIDQEGNKYYAFNAILYSHRHIIDFSNVNFENVSFKGRDLSRTYGIKFNPQLIYKKDLEGTKLNENIEVIGNDNVNQIDLFKGVRIIKTEFNGCKNVVINPQTIDNKDLSGTTLKGVRFNGPFHYVSLWMTNFTGSSGAEIDPKTVKFLEHCISTDTKLLDLPKKRGEYGATNYQELLAKKEKYKDEIQELIKDQLPPQKVEEPTISEQSKQKRKWLVT